MTRPYEVVFALAMLAGAATTQGTVLPHRVSGKQIAGHVLDAETGNPIAGAHVAFLWRSGIIPSGFTGHNSRDICYHAAAQITDAQGRFDIPPWKEWTTYEVYPVDPIVIVYVPAYNPMQLAQESSPGSKSTKRVEERYVLERFEGTVDQRLDVLFFGLANQGCDYGGKSKKSLYPMLKAIHDEARRLARTRKQFRTVQLIAELAADAALAISPNTPVDDAKTKAFIEEHMK